MSMESQTRLKQVAKDLIKRAGGPSKVARRFKVAPNVVGMWKHRGCFPPSTYMAWQEILKELNVSAPAELWKQKVTE